MVILGILLVLAGAGLLVAEAHLPTFGLLGVAGLVSLVAGALLAIPVAASAQIAVLEYWRFRHPELAAALEAPAEPPTPPPASPPPADA